MSSLFRILRIWALSSLLLGILVGKYLKANRRATTEPRSRPPAW